VNDDALVLELATAMCETLRRAGQVMTPYRDDEECELLRRAGRKAGRLLDRPVRTRVSEYDDAAVVIAISDWGDEHHPLEARLSSVRTARIMNDVFTKDPDSPHYQGPPSPRS
jgi:hypothetical protein